MAKKIVNFLMGLFGGLISTMFGKYLFIFIISLLPILELRGGLIAASLLDMPMWSSVLVCLSANILIIPIVLFLMEKILDLFSNFRLIKWWKERALSKKGIIENNVLLSMEAVLRHFSSWKWSLDWLPTSSLIGLR